MLNPTKKVGEPFVTKALAARSGPVVATTDYMKSHSDQIREFVPDSYRVMGTDGYGRSDTRENLRHFFEVDAKFIVLAALTELKDLDLVSAKQIHEYMKDTGIESTKTNPLAQSNE